MLRQPATQLFDLAGDGSSCLERLYHATIARQAAGDRPHFSGRARPAMDRGDAIRRDTVEPEIGVLHRAGYMAKPVSAMAMPAMPAIAPIHGNMILREMK